VKVGIACILLALSLAGAVGGAYWLALRALRQSEQALCPALGLFTRTPVPAPADPAANPSRVQTYRLYRDFRQAERSYRCSPATK